MNIVANYKYINCFKLVCVESRLIELVRISFWCGFFRLLSTLQQQQKSKPKQRHPFYEILLYNINEKSMKNVYVCIINILSKITTKIKC